MHVFLLLLVVLVGLSECRTTQHHRGVLNQRREAPSTVTSAAPQWFTQVLDHTAPQSKTFQQKYFTNTSVWNPATGPILFMLGGEGALSPSVVGGHFILNQHAELLSGLMVSLEHRFYGDSLPDGPGSDTPTAQLKYLSSRQALADAAAFQAAMTTQWNLVRTCVCVCVCVCVYVCVCLCLLYILSINLYCN
jgi:hypothetical protein